MIKTKHTLKREVWVILFCIILLPRKVNPFLCKEKGKDHQMSMKQKKKRNRFYQ